MAIIVEGCVFGKSISTFIPNNATVSFDFFKNAFAFQSGQSVIH